MRGAVPALLLAAIALTPPLGAALAEDMARPPSRAAQVKALPPAAGEPEAAPKDTAPAEAPPTDVAPPDAPPDAPPAWEALRESDAAFTACTKALWRMGADFRIAPPITETADRDCGIARPLRVETILPLVEIPGGAVMRCDTALALGRWLRDFVRPAGRLLPGRPELRAVLPGSTYQCRARVGTDSGKLSEHALGNAFDVAGFRFEVMRDGTPEPLDLPVTPRQDAGDLPEAFQRAVRGAACLYFTTVLGPGSNAAHDDHLHLDIRARSGGFRLCQ